MKTIAEHIFDLGRDCHRSGEGLWNWPCYPTPDKTDTWQWKEAVKLAQALDPIPAGYDPDEEYYWSGDDMIFQWAMRKFENGHDAAVEEEQQTIEKAAMREAEAFHRLYEKAKAGFDSFKNADGKAMFFVIDNLSGASRYVIVKATAACDFDFHMKIRISDHEASPFRELEFGAATFERVYDSREEFFNAVESAEGYLKTQIVLAEGLIEAENKRD